MPPTEAPRAAVLTISTSRAEGGGGEDESGDRLEAYAAALGADVTVRDLIADDRDLIADRLRRLCDEEGCRLVLTTGGTGFAADDVTPEATLEIADREAPGIAEAMRLASREHTPHWMLARNVAVIRGRTLIVNFPGSPKAVGELFGVLAPTLRHVADTLGRDGGRNAGH